MLKGDIDPGGARESGSAYPSPPDERLKGRWVLTRFREIGLK